MGNLSNLYISQSYQSLIHLGTDTALVPGVMTELQDGLGNPLNLFFDGTNISSSGNIFAANVGGGSDISKLNAFTASQYISNSFFATTGSNTFRGNEIISGNVIVSGAVSASTLRVDGLNYPTADNGAKSFMQTDGAGNLSLQYVDTIWEIVRAGQNVTKGTPLYISGSQGANPIVYAADAADPNKMPVTYIAGQNMTAGNTYNAIVLGLIEGINLTGYIAGDIVYVAEGGGWTTNLPSGSNSITQVLGVVTKGGNGGKGLVLNPGPAALPGLQTGYAWVGNGNNRAISVPTSSFGGGVLPSGLLSSSVTNFTDYSQSVDSRINGIVAGTGFATTGSNTFTGNQTIFGNVALTGSSPVGITFTKPTNTESFRIGVQPFNPDTWEFGITGSSISQTMWLIDNRGGTRYNTFTAPVIITGTNSNLEIDSTLTASLAQGNIWVGNASGKTYTVPTASFAKTGSNAFNGDQIVTGSVSVSSVITLGQSNPLPTGADGQLAVSASNLYFYSGSAWNKIAFA